ncbi:hypothetical protein BD769DRAFT_1686288 [Suillus cothurnatus]|nr:hypothetical protein BD769DRAFT_1686288 [Suillus cothurnatus]
MNISGSMQISEKPNSSSEKSEFEPWIGGWPEFVDPGSVWCAVEDDHARKDQLSKADQCKLDWEAAEEWQKAYCERLKRSSS